MTESWALSGDLARPLVVAACVLGAASLLLLSIELGRRARATKGAPLVAASGLLAVCALLLAVLRPASIEERASAVGARLVLLVDASRSLDLGADRGGTRRAAASEALAELLRRFQRLRVRPLAFGSGPPRPLARPGSAPSPVGAELDELVMPSSDLGAALGALARESDELPAAIVVVSDGRLDRPVAAKLADELEASLAGLRVPIHTVAVAEAEPRDAAVRAVHLAGALVAHQPAALSVEIACTGGFECGELPVRVRELHLSEPAVTRASGTANVVDGAAKLDLEVTLDRAGKRILEVAIDAPDGDTIPDNDHRFLTVDVARDRIRLLHVAGRPTYDVRALRTWLKSDASVDVVAFFILRTLADDVHASTDDLALIPFPVDELFTKHLQSFDAVVLQDFDAAPYGLSKHLGRLASYVRQGGGLIMVGGPSAFVSGSYAHTPLADVLPVGLDGIERAGAVDLASFVPRVTGAGRHAPVLEPLRALLGEQLPELPGTNVVGEAHEGVTVLLEHPTLLTARGEAMPVLALGEYGSGRSIALTVDGSHRLLFSTFALATAGRAHGAFWDALLGWLMRDPRFEPATVLLPDGCIAGVPTSLRVRALFADESAHATVTIARMGTGKPVREIDVALPGSDASVPVPIGVLEPGGYTATVQLKRQGRTAPSRYDFACEAGGEEWADPRPDRARLRAIADATGGKSVTADEVGSLPFPEAMRVVSERRVQAVLPPWAWALLAASCLGGHWLARRRGGLA